MEQQATVDLLSDPATHGGDGVVRITTHISAVFLAGERAYKLKRAVRYPFVDFSTVALRKAACEAEVRVNRRTAPGLYLGVAPVIEDGGRLRLGAIGDRGDAVDWLVVMHRFDQDVLLDRMAARGALSDTIARDMADAIAAFHATAEPRPDVDAVATLRWVIADNADAMAAKGLPASRLTVLQFRAEARLGRIQDHLDGRRRAGFVRHGHGDLHLRNVCLLDGHPTPFDAIEFDDRLAVIDVAYDLAFMLMDLDHRRLRGSANLVFNRYVDRTGDLGLVATLPLFMGLRAAVRAKVAALTGSSAEAGPYLDLACAMLDPPAPALVAIGGLSGTGKSTLARSLAPRLGRAPGALVRRSDAIRKHHAGVAETDRLPRSAYTPEASRAVYATLDAHSAQSLAAGHAVVADAVFARTPERAAIEAVARQAGAPFTGLWLDADPDTLRTRVAGRVGDASDADADVVAAQSAYDFGEIRWHRVDARGGPEVVLAAALAILGPSLSS